MHEPDGLAPRGPQRTHSNVPREAGLFSPPQQSLVRRALDEAEEHTSNHYCIPPHRWDRFPYDLITRKDREWAPIPEAALAKVQRIEQLSTRRKEKIGFYRIQLNDPTILSAARRENLEDALYPFLVYILTHEMVHLVRLGTLLGDPEPPLSEDVDLEEERVDRISRRILVDARCDLFHPVLERFQRPCL